jgi:HD-GYP domain-containing protein (c-di-GMP phosphodiesterase class II)
MVRISDIVKHGYEAPEPDKDKKPEQSAPIVPQDVQVDKKPETEGIQITPIMPQDQPEAGREMQVAKAMREMQLDPAESLKIYNQALVVMAEVSRKAQSGTIRSDELVCQEAACEIIKILVDRIVLGDKELILAAANCSETNYSHAHPVNVCIHSIDMGLAAGYNKSKLNELGLGALLHDVGIGVMSNFVFIKESHKGKEMRTDISVSIKNIQNRVVAIARQSQEKISSKGFTELSKDDQIYGYAQIVAIVEVYEALIHPRDPRQAFDPHNAIKELLNMSNSGFFKPKFIKILIDRIGLYPIGSWLELNTGEIGRVISTNENAPLRPKVSIFFDPDKKKLSNIKPLDLSTLSNIFIKRSIDPSALNLKLE